VEDTPAPSCGPGRPAVTRAASLTPRVCVTSLRTRTGLSWSRDNAPNNLTFLGFGRHGRGISVTAVLWNTCLSWPGTVLTT